MNFLLRCCFLALFVVGPQVGTAAAQVVVRAPLTQVEVAPGQIRVLAPFVRVQVSGVPQLLQPPPPIVAQPLPAGPAPIVVMPPLPAGVSPPTAAEFAAGFKPLPGAYEVVLLHPFTGQPVKVCFTLPYTKGCYRVRVRPRYIEFDAPDRAVEILFLRNGRVEVEKY